MAKKVSGNQRGRPRAFCEVQALDAAMRVFASKGFEETSQADLEAAMGINRVSMYAAYGNKEELFLKALAKHTETSNKHLQACLAIGTARQAIYGLLHSGVTLMTSPDSPGSCFVTQLPLKNSEASEKTKQFVAQKRSSFEQSLRSRFDRAIDEGELPSTVSTKDLARYFSVLIQGLALQAQHGGTTEELLKVVEVAMTSWPAKSD